jgi:N-acetylglucosaminyldiphosphoundecaprenol N-acetyl-beta-D-mannosaminyltransferase
MGVGGSFDVVAEKVNRAPLWMQKYGLEWFYRFLQEPGRMWKRYLYTNSMFLYLVFKEKLFGNNYDNIRK